MLADPCRQSLDQNICFQLALCYKIGFGGPRDESRSSKLLSQSGKDERMLDEVLERIKSRESNDDSLPGTIYTTLDDTLGLITSDSSDQYYDDSIAGEAAVELARETQDIEASLGRHNFAWTLNATVLADLYTRFNKWDEALILCLQAAEVIASILGTDHPSTLSALGGVSQCYKAKRQLEEAEALDMQVLETKRKLLLQERLDLRMRFEVTRTEFTSWDDLDNITPTVLPRDIQARMSNLSDRITECLESGRWDDSDALQDETLEILDQSLGDQHHATLSAMHGAVERHKRNQRWADVERLQVKETAMWTRTKGLEDIRTIKSTSNLALTYTDQGRWDEAEKLQVRILEASVRNFGPEHSNTLAMMGNLVITYEHQQRHGEAEQLVEKIAAVSRKDISRRIAEFKEYNISILSSMEQLAVTYSYQGRWDEAEELEKKVLEGRERLLGSEHPHTQLAMANLAATRDHQVKSISLK
jgi:tetratricopeptide (TPR) repeat protein